MQLESNKQCKTVCNTLCEGQKHSQDLRLPRKRAESHHKKLQHFKNFHHTHVQNFDVQTSYDAKFTVYILYIYIYIDSKPLVPVAPVGNTY